MIETVHLFPILDKKLIELLRSLKPEDWSLPTVASRWNVKDVAAHLLDGNMRALSISRDKYLMAARNINNYTELVNYLNQLNADWVTAMQRVSPAVLINLLEQTGQEYCEHLKSLPLNAESVFPVSWAGERVSKNWFHIAREYTEKFHHQQQIREAVNKPEILTDELYKPFLDTIMQALPYTYRDVQTKQSTCLQVTITGNGGGDWFLLFDNGWKLHNDPPRVPVIAHTVIDGTIAWKLFTKSWRKSDARNFISMEGDLSMATKVLDMISVMA